MSSDHPETRLRLLQASLHAFGRRDYDSVSTRQIASAAEANISAIAYYFDGKRGLYLATAEYLAELLGREMQPHFARVDQRIEQASPQECRRLLSGLIKAMLGNLLGSRAGEDISGFILREQNYPSDAFDILYQRFMLPMHISFARLVGRIRNAPAESEQVIIVTHALIGQIIIFRSGQTTALRRLDKKSLSAGDIEQIAELIAALSDAAINFKLSPSLMGASA